MSQRALIREAALAAAVITGLLGFSAASLHHSFQMQDQYARQRLQKAVASLIEHAYHDKDDLVIQETISSVGKVPGVFFACVVDLDGKIVAHSQPEQLNQPFHASAAPVILYPLYEGRSKWGTLVFSLSNRIFRRVWFHEVLLGSLGALLVWLVWMARSVVWRRSLAERDHRIADLSTMADEQNKKSLRENEKQTQARTQWMSWLQNAADHVPGCFMVLDQRQRIVAVNKEALRVLGINSHAEVIGKSWYELPQADSCRANLQCLNLPANQ